MTRTQRATLGRTFWLLAFLAVELAVAGLFLLTLVFVVGGGR